MLPLTALRARTNGAKLVRDYVRTRSCARICDIDVCILAGSPTFVLFHPLLDIAALMASRPSLVDVVGDSYV